MRREVLDLWGWTASLSKISSWVLRYYLLERKVQLGPMGFTIPFESQNQAGSINGSGAVVHAAQREKEVKTYTGRFSTVRVGILVGVERWLTIMLWDILLAKMSYLGCMERLGNKDIKDRCEGWDCFHHIALLQGLLLCGVLFPYSLVYLMEISGIYWRTTQVYHQAFCFTHLTATHK